MKGGTQAAVAIGVGYVLGRRRKMRTATLLVAATAAGGMSGVGGAVLGRGAKALGSTGLAGKVAPQLGEITDAVRGDLLDAGKAAAVAAVNGRIESLTDSLHDRALAIRDPAAVVGEAGDTARRAADDTVGRAKGGVSRRGRRASEDMPQDEDGPPLDEEERADAEDVPDVKDADEESDAPPRRRAARRSVPVARTRR